MRVGFAVLVLLFTAVSEASSTSRELPMRFEVVVNANNTVAEISAIKLREILMGNVREWPNRRRITIVQREALNPTIAIVLKTVLGISGRDYTRYLLQLEFRGGEPLQLKTLLSDEGACEYVHNVPGALAFFSAETLTAMPCGRQVRVVPLLESVFHSTKVVP